MTLQAKLKFAFGYQNELRDTRRTKEQQRVRLLIAIYSDLIATGYEETNGYFGEKQRMLEDLVNPHRFPNYERMQRLYHLRLVKG